MIDLFRLLAPEFSAVVDADLVTWFALVEQGFNPCAFGARLNEASVLLTAHRLTVRARQGEGGWAAGTGPVKSRSTGGESISFGGSGWAATSPGDEELAQTSYGLQFLAIRNSRSAVHFGLI